MLTSFITEDPLLRNNSLFLIISLIEYINSILIENKLSKYTFNILDFEFLDKIKGSSLSINSCDIDENNEISIKNSYTPMLESCDDDSYTDDLISNYSDDIYDLVSNGSAWSNLSDCANKTNSNSYYSLDNCSSEEFKSEWDLYINNSNLENNIYQSSSETSGSNEDSYKSIEYYNYNEHISIFSSDEIASETKYSNKYSYKNNNYEQKIERKTEWETEWRTEWYINLKYDYDIFYLYILKINELKKKNIKKYKIIKENNIILHLHTIQNAFFDLLNI